MNKMGIQAFDDMKVKKPKESNPKVVNYVHCVAFAVAKEATDKTGVKKWEVVVFRDNTANAFALPGGRIGVHTGLLKVAVTPGQLAAVLGHEVGHVIARHGNERVSQAMAANAGLTAASIASHGSENQGLLLGALGVGAQLGVLMPFGRTQESEADIIGLDLMARAGFDPRESVELWKNMGKASGGKSPPQFLSTHPSHSTRIENLQSKMDRSVATFNQARSQGKNPTCKP